MFAPLCSSSVGLSVHHDFTSLQIFATHYSIVKYLSFLCFSATRSRWGTISSSYKISQKAKSFSIFKTSKISLIILPGPAAENGQFKKELIMNSKTKLL